MALAACRSQAAAPSATPVAPPPAGALPSVTAPPTAVLLPSATPAPVSATPLAQPSPAAAATPDPNEGVGAVVFADPLDGSSGWNWEYAEPGAVTFSLGGGQLNAVMSQPNIGARFAVGPSTPQIGDQQLRVTARTHLCYERDEYGVAFRLAGQEPRGNPRGYVFKLTCGGLARLEAGRGAESTVLADWTPSPAIVSGAPAENHILIWAAGQELRAYVNDRFLFSVIDQTYDAGFYAFFLRDRTNGGEAVSFSGLEVRRVVLP